MFHMSKNKLLTYLWPSSRKLLSSHHRWISLECYKRKLVCSIDNVYTQEMDELRKTCFPGNKPIATMHEHFDDASKHIIIKEENKIIACGRLTPGPNGFIKYWTQGKAEVPVGVTVLDIGRFLVKPSHRGLRLYQLLCILGLEYAKKNGFKCAVAAYNPGNIVEKSLRKVGFENSGERVYEFEPNDCILVQPIVCDIAKNEHLWPLLQEELTLNLNKKGFALDFDKLNEPRIRSSTIFR